MEDKIQYTQLNDNAGDLVEDQRLPLKRRHGWLPALGSFFLGLATMGVLMALYSAVSMPQLTPARKMPHSHNGTDPNTGVPLAWSNGDCGNSPEEARSRDCRFTMLFHAWLPKSCLSEEDDADAKEMYEDRDWVFRTDSGQNLTLEELAAGDYPHVWSVMDYHVTHCMYVLKRLHRVMLDPSQELDSYTASYHHTTHCVKMIGRPNGEMGETEELDTKIFVKYPKCAK